MPRKPPVTARLLSRSAIGALTVVLAVGGGALAAPAEASTPSGGPTGLHDGMMPADSPDASTTTGTATTGTSAAVQAASVAPPLGVDVSSHQHPSGAPIDWAQVAASGQKFAIVKATELYTDDTTGLPVLYTNPSLQSDLAGAQANGLVVGTYAFAHPENSATVQADDFAAAIGTLPPGSLPPVLDLEVTGGLSVSALVSWTHAFLNRLEADTGTLPMIYTSPNFWQTYLGNSTAFASYPLWEAHYTTAAAPYQIGGWSTYTLWQYTSTATVNGISTVVDQDRFNDTTGATLTNLHAPTGSVDTVQTGGASQVTVSGWALDPDTPTTAASVRVTVDGVSQTVTAGSSRPDVGMVYPAAGSLHGYTAVASISPGPHTVCVSAIDTSGSGQTSLLGCRTATLSGSWFYLNDQDSGPANTVMSYGQASDDVLAADTGGTGDRLVIRQGNQYYLRSSLTSGPPDTSFSFGRWNDVVYFGDWDGDGIDTPAVRRGNTYYVSNSLTGGAADTAFSYGRSTDTVLVGDWNGDGKDTLAVRRGNMYYIRNSLTGGPADFSFSYGRSTDTVLVGDWNGDGTDTLAVRRGNTYYVRNSLTSGPADLSFSYGRSTDTVLVGDWNGDGTDTLGVRRVY